MNTILNVENIVKTYGKKINIKRALNHIQFSLMEGEFVSIMGPSGSGKTTLLNCISTIDAIDSGHIYLNNQDMTNLTTQKAAQFRKENLGFIFQTYNLLEHLNVYENVLVGSNLGKTKTDINEIIETVGLKKHCKKYMYQLSGGEQQRVSIARALAKMPKVMFCDEPTGALDEKTGKIVLKSLVDVNEKMQTTMVIVTHNPGIALIGDRVIKMNSGKIIEIIDNEKRTNPKDIPWG